MLKLLMWMGIGLIATFGVIWLLNFNYTIKLTGFGYDIQLNAITALILALVASALIIFTWFITRNILSSPKILRKRMAHNRRESGLVALSDGLLAIATGDRKEAQKYARIAHDKLGDRPAALLLASEAARLNDNEEALQKVSEKLLSNPQTKVLALRGLYHNAVQQKNTELAYSLITQALEVKKDCEWALNAHFNALTNEGNWAEALKTLAVMEKAKIMDYDYVKKKRAVLLTAESMRLGESEAARAVTLAKAALKSNIEFVPAVLQLARSQVSTGYNRSAISTLSRAWARQPNRLLGELMLEIVSADTIDKKLKRIRTFVSHNPEQRESHLLLAQVLIEADQLDEAMDNLSPLQDFVSERVCLLMAALLEKKDEQMAARMWLTRAVNAQPEATWISEDGDMTDEWKPHTSSGQFDGYRWMVPTSISQIRPQTVKALSGALLKQLASPEVTPDETTEDETTMEPDAAKASTVVAEAETAEVEPVEKSSTELTAKSQEKEEDKPISVDGSAQQEATETETPEKSIDSKDNKTGPTPSDDSIGGAESKNHEADDIQPENKGGQEPKDNNETNQKENKGKTNPVTTDPLNHQPDDPGAGTDDPLFEEPKKIYR